MTDHPPARSLPRTLVAGGGIAGLTAAIALARRGLPVDVVEKAPAFGAVGAGITIQANAHAVLRALEIPLPDSVVVPIGQFHMLDPNGRVLVGADPAHVRVDPPSVNIHRADLQQALVDAADGIALTPGRAVESLEQDADGVTVRFADGTDGRWDLVIGADGVHSAVRRALYGEAGCATRYSGQTCWRFAAEVPGGVPTLTIEQWGRGKRAGVVPMAKRRVYVYLVENAPAGTPGPGSNTVDVIRQKFGGMHPDLDPVFDLLDGVPIHHGDLVEHAEVRFGEGRVVLIGDAAHAMTPNLGQGAGTAIEDAGALALLMGQHAHDLSGLVPALDAARRRRVTSCLNMARRIGAMAHWTNPVACWLRNLLLRSVPDSVNRKQTAALWQPGLDLAADLGR